MIECFVGKKTFKTIVQQRSKCDNITVEKFYYKKDNIEQVHSNFKLISD